jgi:hypothetical protein
MLSRQPLFLYGWSFVDWDDFDIKLERLFASLPSSRRINPDMLHLIRQSHAAREQVDRFLTRRDEFTSTGTETLPGNADSTDHFHPTTDLKGLLYNANFFEASDERDKIYAFLGLTDAPHGIVPHYSEENRLDKVFYEVTKQLILLEDSLEVLKYTWCSDDRTECSQSWVVSWSRLHIPKVDRLVFIPDKFLPKDWHADASFQELPNAIGIALNVWGIQLPPDFVRYAMKGNKHVAGWGQLGVRHGDEGWEQQGAREGDEGWILYGLKVPVYLRPTGEGHFYRLINAAVLFRDVARGDRADKIPDIFRQVETGELKRERISII